MDADDRRPGATGGPSDDASIHRAPAPRYVISVTGHLDARWTASFDGMQLVNEHDGTTTIRGPVVDQAALHGLLQRLHDAGIPLLSLTPAPDHRTTHRTTATDLGGTEPKENLS